VTRHSSWDDFRTVISFLWSDFHNVDTDGDSQNPASRQWTDLHILNRENSKETVDIMIETRSPLVFRVESKLESLAARIAFFLAEWCHGEVRTLDGCPVRDILALAGQEFSISAGMARARSSIWNKSTLANPYPNQEKT